MAIKLPIPNLAGLTTSPVLMVGLAGAAGVAGLYVFSKNRPQSEVVGGQMPFSFDALMNWLQGHEGGPGGGGNPGPIPPGPLPLPHFCPPGSHYDASLNTCVSDTPQGPEDPPNPGIIHHHCPPGMDCYTPPDPIPSVQCQLGYHWNGSACVPDGGPGGPEGPDSTPFDNVHTIAVGGGSSVPLSIPQGFSPELLYQTTYNLLIAEQMAGANDN